MVAKPQMDDEGSKFLRVVAEEMRALADRDPNIALELWEIAADLENAADEIPGMAAASNAPPDSES
jgi:hypothetical protein